MNETAFKVTRESGLTNTEVILNMVGDSPPGTTFPYAEIALALSEGASTAYDKAMSQQAVRQANRRLLSTKQRVLRVVPNTGYTVAHAREHAGLAQERNRRGDRQYRMAMHTLVNARTDEMTPEELSRHNAQLIINEEQRRALRVEQRRTDRLEVALGRLLHRLDQQGA